MSVLVRGMEMPKSCEECELLIKKGIGEFCQFATVETVRPKDCPLVEVPTPHGRLIDADALSDKLGISDRDIYCKCVIEEDAPTIIEAEGSGNENNNV